MKQKKLAPFLAVVMSLELVVSPVIGFAQTSNGANTAQKITDAINGAAQLWSTVQSMQQPMLSPQQTYDMQKLAEQQTPTTDKYFNMQKLQQIPGLVNYLAANNINPQMLECKTLPTTMHEIKAEVCQMGVTTDRGVNPQSQLQEMWQYYNSYFQINKQYKNFLADSNSGGQLFGVGCMKNAMNILNGFFKYRTDELDKLTTKLEAIQAQFKNDSKADLNAIEEAVAVLEGGNSEIASKVRNSNPNLFNYGNSFNNPACTSILSSNDFTENGKKSGLNGIKKDLNTRLTTPSGKYSGESFSKAYNAVVEDINSLATKVSKQSTLNFSALPNSQGYSAFLNTLKNNVSSTTGVNSLLTADLFSDTQMNFSEKNSKLQTRMSTVASELKAAGVDPSSALNMVSNLNASNFSTEVASLQNQIQNSCLQSNLGASLDGVLAGMVHSTASTHANKNASNFLKDKIKAIIENDKTSLDKKISELQALQGSETNYFISLQNKRQIQVLDDAGNIQTIDRTSKYQTPSSYFIDSIKNCQAIYKKNALNNSLTGASAIAELTSINNAYKTLANENAASMANEIKKKLIECTSPEIANNSAVGSCTPELFNTQQAGFCANAALSCSKNMQACSAQAEKFVQDIQTKKTTHVNSYKAMVDKNKRDVVAIFDTALAQYMREGELMRGIFGAGFASPTGIQREVAENGKYLTSFQDATAGSEDGRLLLEDPDKYVEMFKKNIALLKDSVKKQQDQILGGENVGSNTGLLANHIKQTESNYKAVANEAQKVSDSCIGKYQEFVRANEQQRAAQQAEATKKQSELGEKKAEYCQRFNMAANGHIGPACSENIDSIGRVVGDGRLATICAQTQSSSTSTTSSPLLSAQEACMTVGVNILSANSSSSTATPADASAPAPDTAAPATTSRPSSTGLKTACENLYACIKDKGTADTVRDGNTVKGVQGCNSDSELKNAHIGSVMKLSNSGPTVSMDDAPYYCNAGYDAQGTNKGNMLDSFNQQLRNAMGTAQ